MRPLLIAALCFIATNAYPQQQPAEQQRLNAERAMAEAAAAKAAAERAAAERPTPCAPERQVVRDIDLDRPGALGELEQTNPKHFAALQVALKDSPPRLGQVATWMRTRMNACDVWVGQVYKTSLPPQATVSFVIDDTRYRKTMYIDSPRRE